MPNERKTIDSIIREVYFKSKNRNRTLKDIKDKKVKDIIETGSSVAIESGVTRTILNGIDAGHLLTGAVSASTFSAIGSGLRGIIPSLRAILDDVSGFFVGVYYSIISKIRKATKNANKKDLVFAHVLKNQNTVIRDLQKEVDELVAENKELVEQNERYKYLIGILATNEELLRSIS